MGRILAQSDVNLANRVAVALKDEARHSVAKAIETCGLDWQVQKQLVQYAFDGNLKTFENQYVLTRMDNGFPLHVVGKDYKEIQNVDAFSMLDNLTFIGGHAEIVSAGATDGGKKIWIHVKLTHGDMEIGNGDKLEKHIYLWNAHGGDSFKVFFVPFRLACQNQLTGTFTKQVYSQNVGDHKRAISGMRIVHKGDVQSKMLQAQNILNDAIIHFEAAEAVFRNMSETKIDETKAKTYFKLLTLTRGELKGENTSTRVQNQRDELLTLFKRGKGNQGRTLWDAYNGATEWSDHHRKLKENTEVAANRFYGSGATFKQKALTLATDVTRGSKLILPEVNGLRMPLEKLAQK